MWRMPAGLSSSFTMETKHKLMVERPSIRCCPLYSSVLTSPEGQVKVN